MQRGCVIFSLRPELEPVATWAVPVVVRAVVVRLRAPSAQSGRATGAAPGVGIEHRRKRGRGRISLRFRVLHGRVLCVLTLAAKRQADPRPYLSSEGPM